MPIYKMKGKKDGKQKYRVRINYQVNGEPKQADRVVYGADEAKQFETSLKQEYKVAPDQRITIKQLHEEYMRTKRLEVRASSLDKSKRVQDNHVLPELGDIRLDKFGVKEAQEWKQTIAEKATEKGNPLSLKMKQNIYKELSALLNYAVKMEYIRRNPLSRVGGFKDTAIIKKQMDYYTPEEFKLFIAAAKAAAEKDFFEWNYYVFFAIAFYTGARKGEIHALKWSDIQGEYLSITKSITQKLKGDDVETPPKNKTSIRTLQLPKPLIDIINDHRKRCKELDGFREDMRICGGVRPLRDTSIQNRNKKYSEAVGIKTIRIHDFRHSHASLLANEGINIQEIARRLGHSKIEITWNTYSHLYPREEERAINILNKIV